MKQFRCAQCGDLKNDNETAFNSQICVSCEEDNDNETAIEEYHAEIDSGVPIDEAQKNYDNKMKRGAK